jgi:hypothetical protein
MVNVDSCSDAGGVVFACIAERMRLIREFVPTSEYYEKQYYLLKSVYDKMSKEMDKCV